MTDGLTLLLRRVTVFLLRRVTLTLLLRVTLLLLRASRGALGVAEPEVRTVFRNRSPPFWPPLAPNDTMATPQQSSHRKCEQCWTGCPIGSVLDEAAVSGQRGYQQPPLVTGATWTSKALPPPCGVTALCAQKQKNSNNNNKHEFYCINVLFTKI